MVSLEWATDRTDGVTLVTLRVEGADRARRVRVENRIDGPVWPPRRDGRPAAGWDETGFEGVVEAGTVLPLGYATPGVPADPPAEIVAAEPPPDDAGSPHELAATRSEATGEGGLDRSQEQPSHAASRRVDDRTHAGVVRSLGDPIVPREAVPVPEVSADTAESDTAAESGSEPTYRAGGRESEPTPQSGHARQGCTVSGRENGDASAPVDGRDDGSLSARLAAIERRLAALER